MGQHGKGLPEGDEFLLHVFDHIHVGQQFDHRRNIAGQAQQRSRINDHLVDRTVSEQDGFFSDVDFFVGKRFLHRAFAALVLGALKNLVAVLPDTIAEIIFKGLIDK